MLWKLIIGLRRKDLKRQRRLRSGFEFLKIKVENGCEFLTTQMFFDNSILYNFLYRLLRAGVDVPVVAGVMPVTNAVQIKRGNLIPV